MAMLPIFELRLALPMAYFAYGFNIYESIALSILGNLIPVIPILFLLNYVVKKLSKWLYFEKFFNWLFKKTENRFNNKYQRWGKVALIFFVGIPLPMTGAWTGSLASVLFQIKPKTAFLLIFLGVLLSATIVSLICIFFKSFAMQFFI